MIGTNFLRARHLHDDQLYACYVAEQTGERIDLPAADHLADCSLCGARYADLAALMGELRTDADAEIDAVYSADALRAQQVHIARRLEHVGHLARVISFPHHQATGPADGTGWRVAPRWLAAAAAAGLVIGVGVGSFVQSPLGHRLPAVAATSAPAPQAVVPDARAASPADEPATNADSVDPNDEFLAELEFALARPRTRELRALDELTPHVREVSLNTFR